MERRIGGEMVSVSGAKFKLPEGEWELSIGGLVAPGNTTVYPDGKKYEAKCLTLCGAEEITIEATPSEAMSGFEYVRRVQLTGSIQHAIRHGCDGCVAKYKTVTVAERSWLHTANPKLGAILGVSTPTGLISAAGQA